MGGEPIFCDCENGKMHRLEVTEQTLKFVYFVFGCVIKRNGISTQAGESLTFRHRSSRFHIAF